MPVKCGIASAIGRGHLKSDSPCQDAGIYRVVSDGIVIGALSDGAGSAGHSELGSELAVHATVEFLASQPIAEFPPDQGYLAHLFTRMITTVRWRLRAKSRKYAIPRQELACTLLAFILTPEWSAFGQLGDGFCVVKGAGQQDFEILSKPAKGEYFNQTYFLTSKRPQKHLRIFTYANRLAFFAAATDGLEKVALNLTDFTPHQPFFHALAKFMLSPENNEEAASALRDLLESEMIGNRVDDDRTLFICQAI